MKKLLLLAGLALAAMPTAWSAPLCTAGTLAGYVSLGSDGCMIENTTFSGFRLFSPIANATALAASSVTVTPLITGLQFGIGRTASAGQILQSLFGYQVTGSPLVGNLLSMSGAATTGDGAVTVVEDKCLGGTFGLTGPTGCTGTATALVAANGSSDQITFAPTSLVGVVTDITLDGGLDGSATLASATNQFQAIPEPSSYLLFGSGLCGLALIRRWTAKRAHRPTLG